MIAARRGVEVKTSFVIPNVVASLILGAFLAWAPSYGDMVAGNGSGTFTGIRSHHVAGKVSLTKDRTGQAVLTMTGINVDRVPDGQVYSTNDLDCAVTFTIPSSVNPGDHDSADLVQEIRCRDRLGKPQLSRTK